MAQREEILATKAELIERIRAEQGRPRRINHDAGTCRLCRAGLRQPRSSPSRPWASRRLLLEALLRRVEPGVPPGLGVMRALDTVIFPAQRGFPVEPQPLRALPDRCFQA